MQSIRQRPSWLAALLLCCVAIAGCTTPIGVARVDPQVVYRQQTRNILSGDELSQATRIVLTRWNLSQRFATDPEDALAALQTKVADGTAGSDAIFALAELSFRHARQTGKRAYDLAAAVYAFAFLFPDRTGAPPNPFDPRLRVACDLYNRALTAAFESVDRTQVELRGGDFALPFGELHVAFNPASLVWAGRKLVNFVPIGLFEVRGIRNTYRQAGIGMPLAASGIPLEPELGFQVAPRMKVPITAVLRIADARRRLATGNFDATLEVHTPSEPETIILDGQAVPLEIDRTAALAYGLADPDIWGNEIRGFSDRRPVRTSTHKAGRSQTVPAGTISRCVHPWHGIQRRSLGQHGQRAAE